MSATANSLPTGTSPTACVNRQTLLQQPFVVINRNERICFVVVSVDSPHRTKRIRWMTRSQHNCTTCVNRALSMSRLIFNGTRIKFSELIEGMFPGFSQALNPAGCKPDGIRIMLEQIPDNEHVVGNFTHYTLALEQVSNITTERATEIEDAFKRYFPILKKAIIEIVKQGIASIEIIERVVLKCGADRIYGASLPIMRNIAETCHENMTELEMIYAVVRILSGVNLVREVTGGIVCAAIQQMHINTIPLLDLARTEHALERMIKYRIDPRTYQQPTAPPKAQQLENAKEIIRKALGGQDPKNELVSREIMTKAAYYVYEPPSAFDAIQVRLRNSTPTLAKPYTTLAERCQAPSLREILSNNKNVIYVSGYQETILVRSNAANILREVTVFGAENPLEDGHCFQMAFNLVNGSPKLVGRCQIKYAVILTYDGDVRVVYFQTTAPPPKTCNNFFFKENVLPAYKTSCGDVYHALHVNPLPITTPDFVSQGCGLYIRNDTLDVTMEVNGKSVRVTRF